MRVTCRVCVYMCVHVCVCVVACVCVYVCVSTWGEGGKYSQVETPWQQQQQLNLLHHIQKGGSRDPNVQCVYRQDKVCVCVWVCVWVCVCVCVCVCVTCHVYVCVMWHN